MLIEKNQNKKLTNQKLLDSYRCFPFPVLLGDIKEKRCQSIAKDARAYIYIYIQQCNQVQCSWGLLEPTLVTREKCIFTNI